MKRSISRLNAASEVAFTAPKTAPNSGGRSCVFSVTRVITPRLPPPPPFRPQNSSGLEWALAIRTAPSAVTTSASSRLAAASAIALGEAAEAAALDQAGDTDGQAAAALHVAPRLADGGIGIAPDHAGAERHGRLRGAFEPWATKASCSSMRSIGRVQTSSESGAFDVPW